MQHWVRTILWDALNSRGSLSEETRRDMERIARLVEEQGVYRFRTERRDEIADALSEASGLDELSQLMWEAAVECGVEHATLFLLRQGGGVAFRTRICTSYPAAWVGRYQARSYQFIDPVLARALTDDGPFRFSDVDVASPVARDFWRDAEDHGVGRDGLCAAFELEGGVRIGVSFATRKVGKPLEDVMHANVFDMVAMARIGAEAFAAVARSTRALPSSLSPQELRFLHMLVTADNPEEALSVMPGFGSNDALQSEIRRKLGVRTILQAVALASANNWFDALPYDVRDVASAFPELDGWTALDPGSVEASEPRTPRSGGTLQRALYGGRR